MGQGKASIQLIGNVAREPESRVTPGGTQVTRFSVAVNTRYKDKEEVAFIDCTAFGASGAAFAKFHRKGSRCAVDGRLVQENWDDKQTGAKRSKLCMIVDQWHFVGSSDKASSEHGPADAVAPSGAVSISDGDSTPF